MGILILQVCNSYTKDALCSFCTCFFGLPVYCLDIVYGNVFHIDHKHEFQKLLLGQEAAFQDIIDSKIALLELNLMDDLESIRKK